MSAGLPLKPDIARRGWHGRKVPTADIQLFLTRYSGSMHRYRFSDFKAHQVLSDFQRAGIGLPRFRDEIVNRCRWHLFAGEKNEMCVDGSAMMLAEEGKLDIAAPVAQYLSEFNDVQVGVEKRGWPNNSKLAL
jgi:hypothetical protein